MRKELTIEFIKEQFEKENYILLSKRYKNAKQKLNYICAKKHRHNISWNKWQQGQRCPHCAKKAKPTMEIIKSEFKSRGYELISKKYINAHIKLKYKCPSGHKHSIRWGHFRDGHSCPYCIGNHKLSLKFIKLEFEKYGYKLLTTEYINSDQKLDYICPNGHKHFISWANWSQGNRCPYCANHPPISIEFIKSEFTKERYIFLTRKYINNEQKLEYVCPKGHRHSISWGNWKQGQRCSCCAGVRRLNIEFVRSEFKKEKYILLTENYINAHQKLKYICPKGHRHYISWSNWQSGRRCPFCVIVVSKGEIEVRNFIRSLGIKVLANDKNQISAPKTGNKLELDIFMPDLNKAIEYNGEYWHRKKGKDLLKQKLCKSKNIDLLFIWDGEWKKSPDLCRDKIEAFIFGNTADEFKNFKEDIETGIQG